MNEHETHEEVVKLARRELEDHERINCWFQPEFVRALIDRLEAAHKREAAFHAMTCEANDRLREHLQIALDANKRGRGDCAKLREALVQAELFVGNIVRHGHQTLVPGDKCTACDGAEELRDMICAALAEPVRNCDVGTAEEQEVRFRNYCWNHSSRDKNMECQCPIDTEGKAGCKLTWAQMPYEEGGDK